MEGHLETLKGLLLEGMESCFMHVICKGNKVDNMLEKLGTETHQDINAKEWDMIIDKMGWEKCIHLMYCVFMNKFHPCDEHV